MHRPDCIGWWKKSVALAGGNGFQCRQPIGYTWQGMPDAKITTRILWLKTRTRLQPRRQR